MAFACPARPDADRALRTATICDFLRLTTYTGLTEEIWVS